MTKGASRTRRPSYHLVPQDRPQSPPDGRSKRVMTGPADAERRAAGLRAERARLQRVRTVGWVMLGLSATLFVVHSIDHWQLLHLFDERTEDLTIGYRSVGVLTLAGAACLGQRNPGVRH